MRLHLLRRAVLALCLLAPSAVAQAQPSRHESILIQGEIDRDTLAKFTEALRQSPRARIVLDSPGGSVMPALEIGRIIRQRRLATFIPERALCASACGLIWLAGTPRELSAQALVGFHAAATISEGGRRSVSAPANAIIGGYLRELGFNDEAIFEMTRAPPRGMNWFNTARLNALGITHGASSAPVTAQARPPAPAATPTPSARGLEGLWEGEYRCGREARTARMMIWNEAGRPGASFEFGPTDASPHLEHGVLQLRGTALADGRVRFQPESRPAPGEGPPGLVAWMEGSTLKAEVMNRRCEVVSLRKARS
ncbi:MAG: hypothetical protein K5Q68_19890 [Roseococcus sp.]|nr:hypothetical protein [Roseococcus sp.]